MRPLQINSLTRGLFKRLDGSIDYPEETANLLQMKCSICMARIGKPKGELSAASLADTKGYILFSACHDQ
jgi:hypothetical protein